MLWHAAFWRDAEQRTRQAADLDVAELAVWLDGWMRHGDAGVVAEDRTGQAIGAAWYRFWSEERHSYGFVSPQVPELAIAMAPDFRGQGVGTALLRRLLLVAEDSGAAAASLSVEIDNPARLLYEHLGFLKVEEVDGAWTMIHPFARSLLGFEE